MFSQLIAELVAKNPGLFQPSTPLPSLPRLTGTMSKISPSYLYQAPGDSLAPMQMLQQYRATGEMPATPMPNLASALAARQGTTSRLPSGIVAGGKFGAGTSSQGGK